MSLSTFLIPLVDTCLRGVNRLRSRPQKRARGLLIVRSGGLGDTILFAHVADRFWTLAEPDEPIVFLTPLSSRKTTFLLPDRVEVIAVDYNRFRRDFVYRAALTRQLYQRHFRRVVSTDHLRHPLLDEAMIAACAAPITEGLTARPWPKYERLLKRNELFFTQRVEAGAGPSMLQRWTHLANALSGQTQPLPMATLDRTTLAAPESLSRPTVVLQPYSAVAEKQPSPQLCAALIKHLGEDFDIVVTGGPDDRKNNPAYEPLFDPSNVRFDGRPFDQIVPLLRAAHCVVSADTALMHLAIAVGAPTVGLASAAYIGDLVPYPVNATPATTQFFYTPMPCQGCVGSCSQPLEDNRWACVARLDQMAIIRTIQNLIATQKDMS